MAGPWAPPFLFLRWRYCAIRPLVAEHPVVDCSAARVVPDDVGMTVVIEIPDVGDIPAERMRADSDGAIKVVADNIPDLDVPIAPVVPQDVAGAVTVEIADPLDRRTSRVGAEINT